MSFLSAAADHPHGSVKASNRVSAFSIVLSVLLIVCGFVAIMLPAEMSVGVVIVLSWALMISGVMQFIHVFRCKGIGDGIWKALIALLFLATGLYLRFNLGVGIVTLTLALIAFFVAQGVVDIVTYFRTRRSRASGWLLFEGLLNFLLGVLIWRHWPSSSLWVIGTLAGINMIIIGITRLMMTIAVRRAMNTVAQPGLA
jgi:uncharacterized membrane protein HdeD (DUF308 family)